MDVKIKLVDGGLLPTKAHTHDACFDCYSNENVLIEPNRRKKIKLGFCLELPENHEAIVRPRSGLSAKGLDSCIGTVDENYRGEVRAVLINNSGKGYEVKRGDRICQLAIRKFEILPFEIVDELSDSERGINGFGSTGD